MSRKKILYWSAVISLLLICTLSKPYTVSADDGYNPTSCQFQPPPADRSSTMNSILLVKPKGSNISWDNSYLGLHRWNNQQWPGVDYVVTTTVAFKNGGRISWLGVDGAGGGYSMIVDGTNECQGWREFIGHLAYNPATKYSIGQKIGPDDVIGQPGCSGFTNYCTLNGGNIPPHNHTTLGYVNNISFSDGTQADNVSGYWWIHPSRVEGSAPPSVATPKTNDIKLTVDYGKEFSPKFTVPSVKNDVDFSSALTVFIAKNQKEIIIIFLLLIIIFLGKMIISRQFRELTVAGLVTGLLFAIAFIGLKPVFAQSAVFSPPRESTLSFSIPSNKVAFSLEVKEENKAKETTATRGDCTSIQNYPESILQWCGYIEKYANENGVDPQLIAAVMLQESGGNPQAYSSAGATGLLQVMPCDGIAASYVNANGVPYFSNRPSMDQLYDPEFNISYGTRMLAGLIAKFGSEREGLFHYGPAGTGYYYANIVMNIREKYR